MRSVATLCLFVLLSANAPRSQEPLADGVTTFLGGGSTTAWFEKGGTVWVTDGTVRGTRDTGVPAGSYSVATDRLIVYRQNRIDRLSPDGSPAVLTPPFPFDGFDDDAPEPAVWAHALTTYDSEFIRVGRWTINGWGSRIVGVQVETNYGVFRRVVRPGRYLVQADGSNENVYDLLTDPFTSWRLVSGGADGSAPVPVTGGLVFRGSDEAANPYGRNRFLFVRDHGAVSNILLPTPWGIGGSWNLNVHELTAGFPFVDWDQGPESMTLTTNNLDGFVRPSGNRLGLLWTAPNEQILAHVDNAGARAVLWLDRISNTWNPTTGFGAPTAIGFIGNFQGTSFLSVTDSSGSSLIRYDEASHTATSLASGLTALGAELAPFGYGFVFAAADATHGTELWISDGTPSGTRLLSDLRAGSASSTPRNFVRLGERLLFAGDSPSGLQVWSIDPLQLDWQRNPQNGRFYRLTAPEPWSAAEVDAHNMGGELATVRDASEQDWLASTFGPDNLWIGLSDFDRDGVFEWASGEPLNFTNWCAGQPDHLPGETVVHLANYPGFCVGGWNDQNPNNTYPGIVERSEPPRPVEEFGVGCSPGAPQPVATARWTGGWPRPGGTVDLEFTIGSGYAIGGAMLLGTDSTSFGGVALPLELSLIAAPGCYLHLRPDDAISFYSPTWSIPFALRIPNLSQLRGAVLFVQGFAVECFGCHGFNSVRTTNALRITIGN